VRTKPSIEIVERASQHDAWLLALLSQRWGSPHVVSRGRSHDASQLPGFVAIVNGQNAGLITYYMYASECEIVTFDSILQGRGVGTALFETVRRTAAEGKCSRLWLVTTNDNMDAIRFYQKRGLRLLAIHRDAVEESRDMKPEIPLVGAHGIPLLDEIEMDMLL
jgi:ribosomal protein S18 acetylase RimI-like enzyme